MSTTLISYNFADRQSGKTEIAASIVKGLLARGVDAVYIAPTLGQAHDTAKRYGLPMMNVASWTPRQIISLRRSICTVVMDDVGRFDRSEGDPVATVKNIQATQEGPCQIIAFH